MAKVLSHEEIIQILKQFDEKWKIEDNGKKLKKEFSFSNYSDSVGFLNKVSNMAEQEDHHPQIILEWG